MVAENFNSGQLIYLPFLAPSLRRILETRLLLALQQTRHHLFPLTFYRSRLEQNRLYYRSPIALQLALGNRAQAEAIALSLLTHLSVLDSLPSPLSAKVCLTSQGFLDYYFDSFSLGIWLEKLPRVLIPYLINYDLQDLPQENIFYFQYIHTRCGSLLQLAEQEKLLTLSHVDLDPLPWIIASPDPIPWLKSHNSWLTHPAQRRLIEQILTTIDSLELASKSSVLLDKLFLNLANSLENFERYCRIFGELQQNSPELAQTRLGLLALVQILLKKAGGR